MKILVTLALIGAAGAGAAVHRAPEASAVPRDVPAESWAPRDTADTLWRRGRIAISEEAWASAADHFARLADRYPSSAYAGDALYWQAFALQRLGNTSDLRQAAQVLQRQRERYASSATYTSGESSALLTRINGRLARTGDADAAVAIAELAAAATQAGLDIAAAVLPSVATELGRASQEVRSELARMAPEIRAEMRAEIEQATVEARAAQHVRGRDDGIPAECRGVVGEERIEALNALLQMSADQALPILKRVLERRDRCSEVLRRKAVFLVSQKRTEEAVDILLNVARTDPDRPTREDAVFWLSQTRSDRAVEVLEQILLRESDAELQKKAVFSLSQIRSDRAHGILRDFARRRDASTEVRGEAIFWLGQRRGGDNGAFLRELFPSLDQHDLQEKALFAVAQIRSAENARWLLERAKDRRLGSELRKSALFWAGQGGASVRDLAEIYDAATDDRDLRNQVLFVLSQRRRDPAATDKLFDIAQKERDPELRKQAVFWLGQSGDARAAKLIEDIINKPF